MDLIEAEDIKKRWQEYTEELYKKDRQKSNEAADRRPLLRKYACGNRPEPVRPGWLAP